MKKLESECPVLYYKGQNEDNSFLDKKDFVLILMTNFCIDDTHGTNSYDHTLRHYHDSRWNSSNWNLNLIQIGSGCPVAFCFSNRLDELIFQVFFDKSKEKVGI